MIHPKLQLVLIPKQVLCKINSPVGYQKSSGSSLEQILRMDFAWGNTEIQCRCPYLRWLCRFPLYKPMERTGTLDSSLPNHGVIKCHGLEGTLELILVKSLAMCRDTFLQTRLLRALSNLALNTFRDKESTASLRYRKVEIFEVFLFTDGNDQLVSRLFF